MWMAAGGNIRGKWKQQQTVANDGEGPLETTLDYGRRRKWARPVTSQDCQIWLPMVCEAKRWSVINIAQNIKHGF